MLQEFLFIFVDNCVPRIYWINNVHYDYIGKLLTSKLDSSNQSSWIGSYTMHPCIKNQNWLYAQITKHNYFHNLLRWEVVIRNHLFWYCSPLKLLVVLCTNNLNSHYSYGRNRIFSTFYLKWRNFISCFIF